MNNITSKDLKGALSFAELEKLSVNEFKESYLPANFPVRKVRAFDYLTGRTPSGAIEAALAEEVESGIYKEIILDGQDWIIDRAVLLPSNTELVIDGCKLKLADGVFDNIIRSAGLIPDSAKPYDRCKTIEPVRNIRITGKNGAVLEGSDKPYTALNPKTGVVEPWLGDFFGWRTVGILLSSVKCFEISGFTMQKTHCWAVSMDCSEYGCLHEIIFNTDVKNGDGIDFRNGCAYCMVENISGTTSDDTVACTALSGNYLTAESKYIYPMQPTGHEGEGNSGIHDIVIRNIRTGGKHHGVICLATSPSVYNIIIDSVVEERPSTREACVKIYTGYGTGYKKGNLRNIKVNNVASKGSNYTVMVKADVKNVRFTGIKQDRPDGELFSFEGNSEDLTILP